MPNNDSKFPEKISDFLTVDRLSALDAFIPKNRPEYLEYSQAAYNLKLNSKTPTTVHIETTNVCNQRCYMCCYPDMKRKKMHMEDSLAYKAIDECSAIGVYALHFFFFGEPFANNKTIEYMKYAKDKGFPLVTTTTNFTLINTETIKKLVDYQIDSIHISFEGLDQERYKKIRGTDDYVRVLSNINQLIEYKQMKKSQKPWISLTYVRTTETDSEINEFKSRWQNKINDMHISPQFDYLGRAEIRKGQEQVNSEGIMERTSENRLPCRQLWLRLVVLSNGELVPCSQNMDGDLSVGNIKNTTIAKAWSGPRMMALRAQHLTNDYGTNKTCNNCIDWDWSGRFPNRPQIKK
jgi:radical SAM protein with 4Fe4S-binding SPASM domain